MRDPPDVIEDYKSEYGYMGAAIHTAVLKLRQVSSSQAASAAGANPFKATTNVQFAQVSSINEY